MIPLEIRDQPPLGFARLFHLTLTAIRYRLMRSLLTTVVILVAVAFVINMMTGAVAGRGLAVLAEDELARLRLADFWATRLTQAPGPLDILRQWADQGNKPALLQTADHAGIGAEEFEYLFEHAAVCLRLLQRLERMDPLTRRALAGRSEGTEALDALAAVSEETRREVLARHNLLRDEIHTLWTDAAPVWPTVANSLRRLTEARREGVISLNPFWRQQSPLEALAGRSGEFRSAVARAGFFITEDEWTQISERAHARLAARSVESGIESLDLRRSLAARLDRQPQDILPSLLWRFLRSEGNARWFLDEWAIHLDESPPWTPAGIAALARENRSEANLARIAVSRGADTGGVWGLGQRTTVLVAVSLLVCIVGITNAMLMSVTERYREIATLKCLGALDMTVLWIFVLEALLLGLVGAGIGAFAGIVIALVSGTLSYGTLFIAGIPWWNLVLVYLVALCLGALMAATASVYPSWKAARLPPLEAMRIE